jgi:hypothetical protein
LVIRFWEHELHHDLAGCIEILKENLENHLIKIANFEYLSSDSF